jgi:oligopeptide transport system substrate-binding protein
VQRGFQGSVIFKLTGYNFQLPMKHFAIYILSLAVLAGCGTEETQTDARKVFKYNEMGGITSLDPAAASNFERISAVNQMFNGLVQMDDSLRVQPSIAKSWKISPDGLVYTFSLRSDVFFHDNEVFPNGKGRKVVAGDFVYSFTRLQDAKVSSALTLIGTLDKKETNNYTGFSAPDDTTFQIFLQKPFTPFLSILSMKFFSVVPQEAVKKYGDDFRSHPVGTGPFMFKMWEEGNRLVMVKNDHYFETGANGERLPFLDAVSVSFIKDRETAFLEFLKGDLDLISGIDAINTEQVLTKNGELNDTYAKSFVMQTMPFLKTDYLGFLVDDKLGVAKQSPFLKKEVRQALNYAIDRRKMVRFLRNNLGTPATAGFVPPGLPSFQPNAVKGYEYNPEKAKELLFLAGYPDGKGFPEISLHTTKQYLELCEFIQSQLAEVGIRMNVDVDNAPVVAEAVAASKVAFFRKSWVVDYPDAENFLSLFYSGNFSPKGYNYTHYYNPQFDLLYEKAQDEKDNYKRYEYYQQMDQMVIDDAPIIPLYYDQAVRLVSKNVSGLTPNPMNLLNLKSVKK